MVPPWPRRAFEDGDVTPTNKVSPAAQSPHGVPNGGVPQSNPSALFRNGTPSSTTLILGGGTLPRSNSKQPPAANVLNGPTGGTAKRSPIQPPPQPQPPEFLKVQLRQVSRPLTNTPPSSSSSSDGGSPSMAPIPAPPNGNGNESSSSSESERESGPGSPNFGFRQRRQDSNASFKVRFFVEAL